MDELKIKALEVAIGFVGKNVCWLSPLDTPTKQVPAVEEIAEEIVKVARIFENYLIG